MYIVLKNKKKIIKTYLFITYCYNNIYGKDSRRQIYMLIPKSKNCERQAAQDHSTSSPHYTTINWSLQGKSIGHQLQ